MNRVPRTLNPVRRAIYLKHRWALLLILLLAAGLRFHALSQDARFHPDEALFATFARRAAVNGDWLLTGALDKTPLSIYAVALSMMLTGVTPLPDGVLTLDIHRGEFAARLPSVLAGVLQVAAAYALARRLYRQKSTALTAALLLALSPFAFAFSVTAFTDGLMLLCITLALWASGGKGGWWAGLWLALGFACKQQAILYLPLVAGAGMIKIAGEGFKPSPTAIAYILFRLLLPLVLMLGLLALWDGARAQESSVLALAAANNAPDSLRSLEGLPRLGVWLADLGYAAGPPPLTWTLLALALIIRLRNKAADVPIDLLLLLYALAYIALHWLGGFNLYDRYWLPLLLPLLLLVARGIQDLRQRLNHTKAQRYFVALLLFVFALNIFTAAPVGGDQGAHDGIDELAAWLAAKPVATVIYDRWLGWELGYYLGTWSDKRLTYFPTPEAMAAHARALAEIGPRYLPAPLEAPVQPFLDALRQAGFASRPVYQSARFIVYELAR